MLFQRIHLAEHRHRAAGAAAGDLRAVKAGFGSALPDGVHEKIHFLGREMTVVLVAVVRAIHAFAGGDERGFVTRLRGAQGVHELEHALVFLDWMTRGAGHAISGVGLDFRYWIIVRLVLCEKF